MNEGNPPSTHLLSKLWAHGLGRWGLLILGLWIVVAIGAYTFILDKTPDANRMQLAYAAQPMGADLPIEAAQRTAQRPWSWWLTGDPTLPQWEAHPSGHMRFWLGTDRYGRDLASRLILGARISLSVGLISVFIALLLGIPLGAVAGYYGGRVDSVLQTIIQIFWSIPTFLMVIALSFVLGKGFWQVFIAVGLTAWVEVARLVRGQVLSIKQAEFVQAAEVLGYRPGRILRRHILPQVVPALIVLAASQFASAILLESGLSFLGIGAQPPMPSWGGMIRDHYAYLLTGQAHLALIPGIALASLVLAFMALGTALRDVLDVRS
ncbi:MAG TPA: peptide transporter [Cryomorphaceae bacterium]|jgi:peptide/nickel transport system permease protein|nr:peptide transporter [Cryomorphaceae bacterium]